MAGVAEILQAMFGSIVILLLTFKVQAQPPGFLPQDEVEALREVAVQLGKQDWNFDVNPCGNELSWVTPPSIDKPLYANTLLCNCSISAGQCHVQSLVLTGQNLVGVLPRAIVKLPYLKKLDLTRNFLSGNIPSEWSDLKLEFLSVAVNRLTGQIPSSFGSIVTLTALSIENNLFSGSLPPQIGNLVDMEILILSANNLTGNLPLALSNLTKLTELRISSNNFTGQIPSFIQNWKSIQKLEIQATGLEGPIPSNISALSNLTELRISDLHGEGSEFPCLENLTGITMLMLRNCNISGRIPLYVASMPNLKILDLSFNRLDGNISIHLQGLTRLENLYLTSNMLSGPIPDWITNGDTRDVTDLSYNNFSESSLPNTCRDSLNLFRSTSGGNISKSAEFLNNFACSKDRYSLHINCGGGATTIGGVAYEADEEAGAAARYVPNKGTWVLSNTGHFWDKNRSSRTGNYIVNLHFAEIILRNDTSFQSLGRRIFDVYIQDKRVLKDFDIVKEAGGVDKVVIQNFKAAAKDGTLQIRLLWAGKGTTAVPKRGIYGPLISAIDVESDFKPPLSSEEKRKKLIIAGAVVLPVLLVLIVVILWWKCSLGGREANERELLGVDLQTGVFTFRQIKAATHHFDPANKIGEGGFGAVYKGTLSDGTLVAVKQLSSKSKQGNREFLNEVGMISALQHSNLVRLCGCCVERNQLVLIYEYMENNSLANALFDESGLNLDWPTRQKICIGIAKGLAFIHEESALKIVHRDIKSTNVLLDKGLNPKISDFGLAKLDEEENTHISTRVAGTIGYMAPEYALWGYLTYKADVYSFGIVALETVVGKSNMKFRPDENFVCLLDWALVLQQRGDLMELVDRRLGSKFNKEEAVRMIKVALLCTNSAPALRPTMSEVVNMLQGKAAIPEFIMGPSIFGIESLTNKLDECSVQSTSEIDSLIHSTGMPWTGSSSVQSSI